MFNLQSMAAATELAFIAAGVFFLTGLLTGVWKYQCIRTSADACAPTYVDIAHRSSLMYSFACLLIMPFAQHSVWADSLNLWAVIAMVTYFALAVGSYVLHGLLLDTDNQLQKPHRLGATTLPAMAMSLFMWSLVAGEIGGFVVIFSGTLKGL